MAGTAWGWFLSLARPPGMPPTWLFGPVWTCLYAMIGWAAWLVWRRSVSTRPLRLWGWQLAANAFWVPAFFGLHSPPLALAVSVVLVVLSAVTVWSFARVRPLAAWLMVPYQLWISYAAYLTAGFWWLNRT